MQLPKDFQEEMQSLLGEEADSFFAEYEKVPQQALRFCPLKKGLTKERYPDLLHTLGVTEISEVLWAWDAYYYTESDGEDGRPLCRPGRDFYHDIGLYYIQEPSAMAAVPFLGPRPGERVLDLCAAPGGKSSQIAAMMKGEGILICNDINAARAKVLSQNMERMGAANAIVCSEECEKLAQRFHNYFDKILVDAPCSGEGMFRKNPESMREWSLQAVEHCADRQAKILDAAADMLREGGTAVYSTCTFSREENEDNVASFLKRHPKMQLLGSFRLWPHRLRGEGHFLAVLQRQEEEEEPAVPAKGESASASAHKTNKKGRSDEEEGRTLSKTQRFLLKGFLADTVHADIEKWVWEGKLILFGEQLYRLPPQAPPVEGLRVLRPGLHIGTFKRERFEPSHAFALWLGKEDVRRFIDLPRSAAAKAYRRGEIIRLDQEEDGAACTLDLHTQPDGWALVCVDGFSAGWGKASGTIIKNHYPKGLRSR